MDAGEWGRGFGAGRSHYAQVADDRGLDAGASRRYQPDHLGLGDRDGSRCGTRCRQNHRNTGGASPALIRTVPAGSVVGVHMRHCVAVRLAGSTQKSSAISTISPKPRAGTIRRSVVTIRLRWKSQLALARANRRILVAKGGIEPPTHGFQEIVKPGTGAWITFRHVATP